MGLRRYVQLFHWCTNHVKNRSGAFALPNRMPASAQVCTRGAIRASLYFSTFRSGSGSRPSCFRFFFQFR